MKKARIIYSLLLLCLAASSGCASDVKDADLAGSWYSGSKEKLEKELAGYLDLAQPEKIDGRIFAVIAPHAGYQFSGPVAAYAFKALQGRPIKTVVLLGFTHRKSFPGISVYDKGSFRTPLGEIAIDTELAKALIAQDERIHFYPDAFRDENSVEMQIPFIQIALKDAKVVPVAFGGPSFDDARVFADALAATLKDRDDCVIVASTDLSHYHPYDEANSIDKHTINLLSQMKAKDLYGEAQLGICEMCGVLPVTSVMLAAEKLGYADVKVLKYANSGDTFGDKRNVVGYVSAVIYKASSQPSAVGEQQKEEKKSEAAMLNDAQRKRLLGIARESITSFVRDGKRKSFTEKDPALNEEMGAFVTLNERGELRGCIGNMRASGPLYQTVAEMAVEAATGDPRFATLSPAEIEKIDIEISVLSPLKRVKSADEIKIPGHGVLVRRGFNSGVYLPQVATEAGWNKEEFLTSLCGHKAGMPPDAWKDPSTEMYVFTAEVFGEKDLSNEKGEEKR